MSEKTIVGTKCRHVTYLPIPKGSDYDYDLHVAKIDNYYSDGTRQPVVKIVKDFKKRFWVSNMRNRQYTQKKERMHLDDCEEILAPRHQMLNAACRALNIKPQFVQRPDQVLRGLYCFGTDLSSTAEYKYRYNQQSLAKECMEFASVAAFDVETNIVNPDKWEWIESASLTIKDQTFTVVVRDFITRKFPKMTDEQIIERLHKLDDLYLGDVNKERNIKSTFYVADDEMDLLKYIFGKAHEIKPDIIDAWNMDYDVSRIIEACGRAEYSVADLLSDPDVPVDFRVFKYDPGRESMETKKGVHKNFANFEKWPQVTCASSFAFMDSMCYYYASRKHKGKLPSYRMDAILEREFPDDYNGTDEKKLAKAKRNSRIRKLKFAESSHLTGTTDWHKFMQVNFPFEYVIYNKFDCVALEYLDEQTLDLCASLGSACEFSDYTDFASEPKRLANEMHWFNLDLGYAYGTGGQSNVIDLDHELIGQDGWIITLRSDLLVAKGKNYYPDAPHLNTTIFEDNADIDVKSAYPYANKVLNTSRETLTKELISIEGVDEQARRECGINMSGGFVNASEISKRLFQAPDSFELLDYFDQEAK